MNLIPIGIVVDGYPDRKSAPRQGKFDDQKSVIKIYDDFVEGLEGVERYDRLIILYWFHLSSRDLLKVRPQNEFQERGVFSTRSPERPNPIGLAVIKLEEIDKNILTVRYLDAVTGTPVIDIKPILREVDCE